MPSASPSIRGRVEGLSVNGERSPSTSLRTSRTIDRGACGRKSLINIAESCVQAGVKIIQLRDKTEDVRGFYRNAILIRKITEGKALFIINDRSDIAKLVNADRLHIVQDDLPVQAVRRLLDPGKIIGKYFLSVPKSISLIERVQPYIFAAKPPPIL